MQEGTIYSVFVFPRPWPPLAEVEVLSQERGDSHIRVLADSDGRFCLQVEELGNRREFVFQPIVLEGAGRALLSIVWSAQGASLRLNSQDILPDDESQGERFVLVTKNDPLPQHQLIIDEVDIRAAKSEAESLFLSTVVDIDRKLQEGGQYNLLRAAGLLRQLFLDKTPLILVVNRTRGVNIVFETVDYHSQLPVATDHRMQRLDATMFPGARMITSNLIEFIHAPCLTTDGLTVTVRHLIRTCAHVMGGVHLGSIEKPEEGAAVDWNHAVKVFGEKSVFLMISDICRISLRGLKPLVTSIMNSPS